MDDKSREYADKAILHMNFSNRRMLVALIIVCITFITTIVVFVTGYTAREKNWLDMIQRTGVTDGVYEQYDSVPD